MSRHRNCAGITRRDSLKLGLGGLMASGFTDLLRMRSQAADATAKRPTSCIMVWMDGGPSHYETFDPKPTAPREIRGEFEPIATKIPGVHFAQCLPRLASIADKFTVVRSICHNQNNHGAGNHYLTTGSPTRIPVSCGAFVSFHPSLGAVTAAERGAPAGLPAYFSMPSMTRSGGPSFLGAKYAPFCVADDPNSSSFRVRDVALPHGMTDDRFIGRRDVRGKVDRLLRIADKAAADPVAALDENYTQGYDLVTSKEAQKAFNIHSESDAVRERYGRTGFGQRALLARRLVEAGVPFVTLHDGGWDDHSQIYSSFNKEMPAWENTIATLIEDLGERGLLDTTLIVALGEFGRAPQVNKDMGRDHWSNAMSVLFAGCGVPGGQVIGATDARGYAAVDRILSPENFASTVYRKLGIDPDKILYTPQGRPSHIVSDPTPIRELFA